MSHLEPGTTRLGASSEHGPAIASLPGREKLLLGWVDKRGSRLSFSLSENGRDFPATTVLSHTSTAGVSLVGRGGTPFHYVAAWVESPDDLRVRLITSPDGATWSDPEILDVQSLGNPVIAAGLEGQLGIAYVRPDKRLAVIRKDASDSYWREEEVFDEISEKSPGLRIDSTRDPERPELLTTEYSLAYVHAETNKVTYAALVVRHRIREASRLDPGWKGPHDTTFPGYSDRQPAYGFGIAMRDRETKRVRYFPRKKLDGTPDWDEYEVNEQCKSGPAIAGLQSHVVLAWTDRGDSRIRVSVLPHEP